MAESWKQANERMACLDCGEGGADPYRTTKGENQGRNVRVCRRCVDRWVEFGLMSREPMYEEPCGGTGRATGEREGTHGK